MRIGLIGPAEGDRALLRAAAEFLLVDFGVDQAVYLGLDDTMERVVDDWAKQIMGETAGEQAFLRAAQRTALSADARTIEALLARDEEVRHLSALRCLPPPPARAVEVIDEKIVLFVHDKAQLDEEDIVNAFLVVYGRSKVSALNRFGPRAFFTPGPLSTGRVAVLEREEEGTISIAMFDPNTGEPSAKETLALRRAHLVVQS